MDSSASDGVVIDVYRTTELDDDLRAEVHALFALAYDNADHSYLERSFATLHNIAVARRDDGLVAFSLGEMRIVDLPRLPQQAVALAGLACVRPDAQRQGFFRRLVNLPLIPGDLDVQLPIVVAGRMAHPVSARVVAGSPGVLPRPGHVPTPWQQEVATAIAALYGVAEFDAPRMICRGRGMPVGKPVLIPDVTDEERRAFADVHHDNGDSLLTVAWQPAPPEGWDDA